MAVVQCKNKHYYDNVKFKECPHCVKMAEEEMQRGAVPESASAACRLEDVCYAAGWLVCVGGAEYGRNFPLYAGFNRIGRTAENDIVLTDEHVSGEEHCSVIYEEKKNVFYVVPKAGNLVYADDALVEQAEEIENGTVITAGETELELVVFCKGEKRWEKGRKGRG